MQGSNQQATYVAIHLPHANQFFNCKDHVLERIREVGRVNSTIDFLDDYSNDNFVKSKLNGKKRRL